MDWIAMLIAILGIRCVDPCSYLQRNFRCGGSIGLDVEEFERHDSFDYRCCSGRMVRDQMERIEQAAMRYDCCVASFGNPRHESASTDYPFTIRSCLLRPRFALLRPVPVERQAQR